MTLKEAKWVGSRIRSLRQSRGLRASELARIVRVSRTAVHRWEIGALFPRKLGELYAALRVTRAQFWSGEDVQLDARTEETE